MTQLDLETWLGARAEPAQPDTYADEWASFRAAHPPVFARLLELARAELAARARYLSVKQLWEQLRRWCRIERAGEYKLNNNWTAYAARDLIVAEPALGAMLRTREASAKKAA